MKMVEFNNLKWRKRFTYLKASPFDEKDLGKGIKFQVIKFRPNTGIGPHFHKKITEIFYIQKGKGTIIINNQKCDAKEDDIFLCQPNDMHEIINDSDEELVILNFKVNEDTNDIFWLSNQDEEKYENTYRKSA